MPRRDPATELLITGKIRPASEFLVWYVDVDESGNPRLIAYVPELPRRAA